ncbi:hypothetical protein OKJ48_23095 [Streptomyces kunmingensis]|uniref:Uncharacterized protein n=1 Tax=Streptomyces kunmingensis TaxID=68225 RepID=A0ABU6CEI2_9ACTN|nr:hypothetical protein [Streptomyces kunmingensis]MEB3963112.1 hypothetical protein [Streptomyces kunmingensis]
MLAAAPGVHVLATTCRSAASSQLLGITLLDLDLPATLAVAAETTWGLATPSTPPSPKAIRR